MPTPVPVWTNLSVTVPANGNAAETTVFVTDDIWATWPYQDGSTTHKYPRVSASLTSYQHDPFGGTTWIMVKDSTGPYQLYQDLRTIEKGYQMIVQGQPGVADQTLTFIISNGPGGIPHSTGVNNLTMSVIEGPPGGPPLEPPPPTPTVTTLELHVAPHGIMFGEVGAAVITAPPNTSFVQVIG